jgi:hypothetical protein
VTSGLDAEAHEFLAVAQQALRASSGNDALASLGWWELAADLGTPPHRAAVFAFLRAQGRELADSCALAGIAAQPYAELLQAEPGSIVATITCEPARGGARTVLVGDADGRHVLVDRPGLGVTIVAPDDIALHPISIPGRLTLFDVELREPGRAPVIADSEAREARRHSTALGRVAIAFEILGAAEGVLALAHDHAGQREQFGHPIGTFQAVRHLLAWAMTDCVALEGVAMQGMTLDADAPPKYDQIVKALAGRNGRRVSERTLQVLGAIGFTAEHEHHHFHSRVLALDALLGATATLTVALGRWLRTDQVDPQLPRTALLTPVPR